MRSLAASLLIFFALSAHQAFGTKNIICVMVYNQANTSPCETGIQGFAYVVHNKSPKKKICTREYKDWMCKDNKSEFYHAKRRGGGKVCVLNFFQQVTGNACANNSEMYAYVSEPWED